jgi:pSer/pThr/pTyr-binding forkhead associated (FHA) protein
MPGIEIWGGGPGPLRFSLEGSSYTVGSDPDSVEIPVSDPNVSRVHAALERVGKVWLLRDLGSRNGTIVNGASPGSTGCATATKC